MPKASNTKKPVSRTRHSTLPASFKKDAWAVFSGHKKLGSTSTASSTSMEIDNVTSFDDDAYGVDGLDIDGIEGEDEDNLLQDLDTDIFFACDQIEITAETNNDQYDEFHEDSITASLTRTVESGPSSSPFVEYHVNIPRTPFTMPEIHSLRTFQIFKDNGISNQSSNELITIVNGYIADILAENNIQSRYVNYNLLTLRAGLSLIRKRLPLPFVREHEMCCNGCYLYDRVSDSTKLKCPICETSRGAVRKTILKMVSLKDKFSQMLACDDVRAALEYRSDTFSPEAFVDADADEKWYSDIFSGAVYRNLIESKGYGHKKHDIFIVINMDGFTSKSSSTSMVLINAIVLNLPPTERLTKRNVIPLAILYGNRSKDIQSFLKPIYDELKELEVKPLRVYRNGEFITESNVYCLGVASDLMEASKLMNHAGHQSLYGCKWCKTVGEHAEDEGKPRSAMYFPCRNQEFRTVANLLMEEANDTSKDECNWGISAPHMFGGLSTFSEHFQLMDEFHLFTNVARLIHEAVSPPFNSKYKYTGNTDSYPFQLKSRSYGHLIKIATDMSKAEIPPQFHSSWKGINICDRLKGQYRSTDWINWLINIVPTLITPALVYVDAATALNKLCHAVKLATQWAISETQLSIIRINIEDFYKFLDSCLVQRRISKTFFRVNLHMLSHIPQFVRAQGSLKAYSTRAMERKIGALKRVMNAARYAGENAGNIIEIENMLSFIQASGIVDFDAPFVKMPDSTTFEYHPSMIKAKPQLWSPFAPSVITLGSPNKQAMLFQTFNLCMLGHSLLHYLGRIKCQSQANTMFSTVELTNQIKCSGRIWKDDVVYQSEFYRQKNRNVTRSGYHVLFRYAHNVYYRGRISKSQECWYIAKVLVFFKFKFDSIPESFYALGELLEGSLSPTNSFIPRVKALGPSTANRYVVFDCEDIVCPVGLVSVLKPAAEADDDDSYIVSSFKYVVTPGDAPADALLRNPGKVSNLFLRF